MTSVVIPGTKPIWHKLIVLFRTSFACFEIAESNVLDIRLERTVNRRALFWGARSLPEWMLVKLSVGQQFVLLLISLARLLTNYSGRILRYVTIF